MKLEDCFIGMIVIETNPGEDRNARIGHIFGLTINNVGEVIPLVIWAMPYQDILMGRSSIKEAQHHAGIERYTG